MADHLPGLCEALHHLYYKEQTSSPEPRGPHLLAGFAAFPAVLLLSSFGKAGQASFSKAITGSNDRTLTQNLTQPYSDETAAVDVTIVLLTPQQPLAARILYAARSYLSLFVRNTIIN